MCSTGSAWTLLQAGCPIRRSPDQRLLAATRGLSQQRYVLHRPLVPRHPPCALSSLTFLSSLDVEDQNAASTRTSGARRTREIYRSAREDASPCYLGSMCMAPRRLILVGRFGGAEDDRWWRWPGSNRRPPACKAGALPAELHPRGTGLVGLSGFEPETSRLSAVRSHQLS